MWRLWPKKQYMSLKLTKNKVFPVKYIIIWAHKVIWHLWGEEPLNFKVRWYHICSSVLKIRIITSLKTNLWASKKSNEKFQENEKQVCMLRSLEWIIFSCYLVPDDWAALLTWITTVYGSLLFEKSQTKQVQNCLNWESKSAYHT